MTQSVIACTLLKMPYRMSAHLARAILAASCVVVGCTEVDDSLGSRSTALEAGTAGTCPGIRATSSYVLPNLSRELTSVACVSGGTITTSWLDSTNGSEVDFHALRREDQRIFRDVYHRMGGALRQAAARASSDERVPVYAWFHVPLSDLPSKERLVNSSALRDSVEAERRHRISTAATALLDELSDLLPPGAYDAPESLSHFRVPVIPLRATPDALRAIGSLPQIVRLAYDPPGGGPSSEAYFEVDRADDVRAKGYTGSGIAVALLEGEYPNSFANLPTTPSGTCKDDFGTFRACHCPEGSRAGHVRTTGGVVATSSTSFSGIASSATLLFANWGGGCTDFGPGTLSSAINWALDGGASIINYSWSAGARGNPQHGRDMYFDEVATVNPWPLMVATTGNDGFTLRPENNLRNGLVVGAADDQGTTTRSDVLMSGETQPVNYGGANGWELPHIVAPGVDVDTAGYSSGATSTRSGTSVAAPQISGIAAAIHEANSSIRYWPEAIIPGFLVGVDENVDEAQSGVWPLDLDDSFDDYDGVGLVNAAFSREVLSSAAKRNGGDSPADFGHDMGGLSASATPINTYYSESWHVQLNPGELLVAASIIMAQPSCGSPPDPSNCSSNPYPRHYLVIWDENSIEALAANVSQNYEYISVENTTAAAKEYRIRLFLVDWDGLPGSTYGVAWNTY